MFFDKKSDVFIDDFDSETFKKFLDCLFEFKPYTVKDALEIFPVAYEFNVQKSIQLCEEALNPSSMDENVCLTLNLALYYECDDLTQNVINFLKNNYGIMNVIEDERYCLLLEPLSMATLIEHIEIDSCILKKLYEWGIKYLKMQRKRLDVSSFFEKYNLLKNISLNVFESAHSIYEFNECVAMKNFFTSDEILAYLKSNICEGQNKIPSKSEWVQVEKHFAVKEHINFAKPLLISSSEGLDNNTHYLKIGTNKIVYFISPHLDRLYNALGLTWAELVTCKVNVSWGNNNYKIYHRRPHPYLTEEQLVSRNQLTSFNVVHKNKKFVYSVKLPVKPYYSELVSVDITYTFSFKCRILKTSLDVMPYAVDDGNLYFTSFVELQRGEERS